MFDLILGSGKKRNLEKQIQKVCGKNACCCSRKTKKSEDMTEEMSGKRHRFAGRHVRRYHAAVPKIIKGKLTQLGHAQWVEDAEAAVSAPPGLTTMQ